MRLVSAAICLSLMMSPTAIFGAPDTRQQNGSAAAAEWIQVHPAGETGCAFDTPFSFFYRKGEEPSDLLVYFEGGGACWEPVSCSGMFDASVASDEISPFRGIFDFANSENPFRRHAILFIPYCTGDVHIGDATRRYGDAGARPIAHRGYRNVSAALEWLSRMGVQAPARVVITGTSAGSYGAVFHAPRIAEMFPKAAINVIGDSGVPLLKDYPEILERWGVAGGVRRLRRIDGQLGPHGLTLERAHTYFASRFPRALMAHVTSDRDGVQSAFYLISGSPHARDVTYALLDLLEKTIPRFRSFVVAGGDHGLFVTDKLYSYAVDGVRLVDWLRRAAAGEAVGRHRCPGCNR